MKITGLFALAVIASIAGPPLRAADRLRPVNIDRQVDRQTVRDPALDMPAPVLVWPVDLRPLWLAALQHTESDLRGQAVDSIRQAHRYGMPGLVELRDALVAVLETADETPATRTAAAAALVEMDCRELAPRLAAQASAGPLQLQLTVEQALATWDDPAARETWLARLRSPEGDPRFPVANDELVRLAMESLAAVGELRAVEPLSQVLLSPVQGRARRLTAARALGTLAPDEALQWSADLLASGSTDPQLDAQLGVELLSQQSSPRAIALLQQYADHSAATVVAVALGRLLQLDRDLVLARAPEQLRNRDANVRAVIIAALQADATVRSVELLAAALDDRVPDLRGLARRALLQHADEDALRGEVIQQTVRLLAGQSWRELENAIIVLTELEHRDTNERILALIDHDRVEVQVTAAWGVKHLFEPADAEVVADALRRVSQEILAGGAESRSRVQLHLCEAMGLLKHRPAVPQLAELVPKNAPFAVQPRAAAIWSLGFLLQPDQDTTLIRSLEARLADAISPIPEYPEVRAAAAIALGRIGDPESLPVLRRWYEFEGLSSRCGRSCGWAIKHMTGEPMPPPPTPTQQLTDWFIEPLRAD